MTDLDIDCPHARVLAADLAHCCAPQPAPPFTPPEPVPATRAFHERLTRAVSGLHERHDALLEQGRRLAEDSLAAVNRIEEGDHALAGDLAAARGGLP
ncbi:hypothetical protein V5S96_04565 [Corynebacterium mastitidis]|uniref:Chemotaxis protein n=1 Tax=Corynebacterium mastitidis TaxID=161890 RepID=A0ABU8NX98_9CORY